MKNKKLASIEISNNRLYIIPVLNFIDGLASKHNRMDITRYNQMRFVVGEILRIRIDNSYPGTIGSITVELFINESYFEISIKDKGVPGWHDFSYDKKQVADSKKDMRNFILDSCVDEIGMEKLGMDGQRIFIRQKILNPINFKKPEPYPEVEVLDENINIRPVITEEDIIEAIRCIYSEYGYSYSYERLYYVDSFMHMVKEKQLMSFLAVNDHGQIAGHFAIVCSDLYRNMPEVSTVVIRKEFRGLGLFSKFMQFSEEYAKQHNFRALMGQPVAFHPMSQKAFLRAGYTATSLLMSYLGSDIESEYNKDSERLSLCVSVKIIDDSAYSSVYMPEVLVPLAQKIYDNLGWKYDFLDDFKLSESTLISIENNEPLKMTKIILREASDDLEEILQETKRDAIRKKNEMIELLISLNSQSCDYSYTTAKKCGFSVSGIIPGGQDGDYIVMQILTGDDMDYTKLVMVGEFDELKTDIQNLNTI